MRLTRRLWPLATLGRVSIVPVWSWGCSNKRASALRRKQQIEKMGFVVRL